MGYDAAQGTRISTQALVKSVGTEHKSETQVPAARIRSNATRPFAVGPGQTLEPWGMGQALRATTRTELPDPDLSAAWLAMDRSGVAKEVDEGFQIRDVPTFYAVEPLQREEFFEVLRADESMAEFMAPADLFKLPQAFRQQLAHDLVAWPANDRVFLGLTDGHKPTFQNLREVILDSANGKVSIGWLADLHYGADEKTGREFFRTLGYFNNRGFVQSMGIGPADELK